MLRSPLLPSTARSLVPVLALCLAAAWSLPATAAFLESGGQVVMEAENFTSRSAPVDLPSGNDGAPNDWFVVPDESPGSVSFANARDDSFIQVNDAIGVNGEGNFSDPTGNGPFADYVVRITTTGVYQLNARWDSPSGSSDSFYAFLLDPSDNQVGNVETYSGNSDRDFATNPWDSSTELWTISTPGDYTVRIAPREEGVAVDALVLQLASLPDPVGDGPSESPTDTDGGEGECEVVDFNQLSQEDLIQTLSLFGGTVNLTVTAFRNVPAGAVDVTAYDTEMFDRDAGTPLPEPPNASHDDTQRFILCNLEESGLGECDGIVAMIPDTDFFQDADTTEGGTITISGFTGDWEIPTYDAVDSDNTSRDILLLVGAAQQQVASSTGQGNGTVETVNSDPHTFTGEATFVFEGSGAIDDIELCRLRPPIDIEKFTNGYDADDANGFPVLTPPDGPGFPDDVGGNQVPLVKIGDKITWTYKVTNTGPETLVNVEVTDSEGVMVICPQNTLAPGEMITCMAMGTALDLDTDPNAPIVDGCGAQGMGMTQPTYENVGRVDAVGETSGVDVSAEDPSHYCNPPDVMIKKFTNGHDGDDPNGMPDPNEGSGNPGDPTVAEIPSGGDITWTYVVTNTSSETLVNVVVTDNRGVLVDCGGQNTLAPAGSPGDTFTCTAMGTAEDLQPGPPNVNGCDGMGTGDTRPTYENMGEVEARGETTGVFVEDDDPSHYCNPRPPECGLMIQKGCELPPPPAAPEGKCDGRLQEFTMVWTGGPITVSGPANDAPGGQVGNGDVVTFLGPFSDNDVIVNLSGAQNGQSTFHTSCSDKDMDGDTTTNEDQQQVSSFGRDCGKFQGDGKGSSGINDWLLEGFVDNSGAVLDCSTDDAPLASVCEFNAIPADCDNPDNPENLTWLYSGGGCAASDNDQGGSGDLFCEEFDGGVSGGLLATITDDGGNMFNVEPGGVFTTKRSDSKVFTLVNAGGTEENGRHVSCSQPLQAGDVYGSLTLVGLDGLGLGTNVAYSYLVSNDGPDEVTDILVTDDQLGDIGTIESLEPGDSATLSAEAFISGSTTNVAMADGIVPPDEVCQAESNPVMVKVLPPPPCDVSIAYKELQDDAIKWTLSNDSLVRKATTDTLTLVFPPAYGLIKEVKLDGAIFKADDSDTFPNGVPSGKTIGPDDWTNLDVAKRQLDQGESRTLEVKFTKKSQDFDATDFTLTLTFEEGCGVSFDPSTLPQCDVGIVFDKLEDDKVKWKLTNDSVFGEATLQTFTLDFPAGFDVIKKVKLDGDIYKADDSNLVVGPGVTIGEDDWTEANVEKRELDLGETRTLEVEFEEKDQSASPGDFDLLLTFEEGCAATF